MKEKLMRLFHIYRQQGHRTALFASFASLRNLAYSGGMLVLGVLSWSLFLMVNGGYQLVLSLMRLLNIYSYSRAQHRLVHNRFSIARSTGILMILLGVTYCFINLYFYLVRPVEEISFHYMLMTATMAFAKLGSSIWDDIQSQG